MMTDDKWCPENDAAYRAELAAIHGGDATMRLRARIAALEAQVAAADRLAAATTAFDLLSRDETFCTVEEADVEIERLFIAMRNALAAYRAAKGE